jgi:hypothetical protein
VVDALILRISSPRGHLRCSDCRMTTGQYKTPSASLRIARSKLAPSRIRRNIEFRLCNYRTRTGRRSFQLAKRVAQGIVVEPKRKTKRLTSLSLGRQHV